MMLDRKRWVEAVLTGVSGNSESSERILATYFSKKYVDVVQ